MERSVSPDSDAETDIHPLKMTSIATSLATALPKPKYSGEHEELPNHAQSKGPRILGAGALDDRQVVLKVRMLRTKETHATADVLVEKWPPSLWVADRMATSISGRLRRWRSVSRMSRSPVSSRHGA